MSYIYNKNHDRTHHQTCPAIKMMLDGNAEVIEEVKGKGCGWCGAGLKDEMDHSLDEFIPYLAEEVS